MTELEKALHWALLQINDRAESIAEDETPNHECGFINDPESGYCRFHDKYWSAWSLLER